MNPAWRYLKILEAQPHPLKFLASRVLWRTGTCSLFTIRKQGYRLRFYPTALSAILWIDPRNREADEIFLRRYLRAGDISVDVGANIGDLTLVAASVVGPNGRVYSLEAHPRTYRYLCANVALNQSQNVALFNMALGDKESEIFFVDAGRSDDQNRVSENGRGISMKMARLDDLPIQEPRIHLLKVDVEGYEKFVLQGASRTLERVLCIFFESWEGHFRRYGYTCADVIRLLTEKGFRILRLGGNGTVIPVGMNYSSTALENLVAVRGLEDFLNKTQFRLAG